MEGTGAPRPNLKKTLRPSGKKELPHAPLKEAVQAAKSHIPITPFAPIRLAPPSTTACRLWVAAGYPVRDVSGGGHHCPAWRRHVLDKAIVVSADRRSRH